MAEAPVAENAIAAEVIDASVSTSAASLLQTSDQIALSNPATSAIQPSESQTIAQTPGTSGQRVARFYLGTGGNIGIGDDDDSAIGDFGFAIISKFSLGPRLALRPSLLISDQDVSLAIPLTYNFTPIGVRNFTVAPFAGAGVDIAFDGDTGLLLNVGADIPLSRQFTLTNQANFRVTDDFSVGLIFGVAYNLPGLLQ
ncbi:MAG: hypothetical protein HC886_01000 [Leptolyngbyaceae cyanobacterium SM1_1_3]|nr:hypothetical protein [Leptolyngbyaceae cyanobacterium SM1_1_3]